MRLCLDEFGCDAALDYKADGLDAALAAACPDGVDVYFDNTAGTISDTVLKQLKLNARVVICGTVSVASWDPIPQGPRVERHLLVKRARNARIPDLGTTLHAIPRPCKPSRNG